jgi:glycerophosphoryl diester phosphodiesterase
VGDRVWVIGHRGASGVAPENTLAAFRKAVELGAGFIETDLQLSRDARLIALHDDTLNRTTNGRGPVSGMTLEELRQLDAGSWFRGSGAEAATSFAGERIPTVQEVLAFGHEHEIGLLLEVKPTGPSGAEHAIVGALHASGETPRSVVLSFSRGVLRRIRDLDPLVMTGFLFDERLPSPVTMAVEVGARQLLPRTDRVTRELVAEAHANDVKVVAWTANSPEEMQKLISAGVDGIITDYPDRLVAVLRSSAQSGR